MSLRLDELAKKIVNGYIFDLCRNHQFDDEISMNIYDVCLLFYHQSKNADDIVTGPFSILFQVYNLQSTLKVDEWESCAIDQQCKYLDSNRICSESKRDEVLKSLMEREYNFTDIGVMLESYYRDCERILRSKDMNNWTQHDIIISVIHHVIRETNNSTEVNEIEIWKFIGYFKKYIVDTKYDGKVLWESIIDNKSLNSIKKFGHHTVKYVCWKYELFVLSYVNCRKSLDLWVQTLFDQYHKVMNITCNKSINTVMMTGQQFIYETEDDNNARSNTLLISGYTRMEEEYLSHSNYIPNDIKQIIEQFYGKTYHNLGEPPNETEFDYSVEFLVPMERIGINLDTTLTKIIKCHSSFAQKNIIPNSEIIQINDTYIKDMNFTESQHDKLWDHLKQNGKSFVILRAPKQLNEIGTHFLFDIISTKQEKNKCNLFPYHKFEPPKLLKIFESIFGDDHKLDIFSVDANKLCLTGGEGVSVSIFIDGNVECGTYKEIKMNDLFQREFGRNFRISLSYKMNGLKGYGIDTAWSEIQSSYWEKNTVKLNALIYLVKGVDDEKNAWYYILVNIDKLEKFKIALDEEIIHLEQYGKILYSAYGTQPPQIITDKLKKTWMIQD